MIDGLHTKYWLLITLSQTLTLMELQLNLLHLTIVLVLLPLSSFYLYVRGLLQCLRSPLHCLTGVKGGPPLGLPIFEVLLTSHGPHHFLFAQRVLILELWDTKVIQVDFYEVEFPAWGDIDVPGIPLGEVLFHEKFFDDMVCFVF